MSREANAIVQLKVRIRESLRARLEEQAGTRGHSLNAEVARRLEQSFDHDDLLNVVEFFRRFAVGRELSPELQVGLQHLISSHRTAWELAVAAGPYDKGKPRAAKKSGRGK